MMTLQILFAPATNALGRPGLAVKTGLFGAALMSIAFAIGIRWGAEGLAWAWLAGMSALLAVTVELSRPVHPDKPRRPCSWPPRPALPPPPPWREW